VRIAERHVEPVRRGARREPIEPGDQGLSLDVGPVQDGRATADSFIQLPDLGCAPPGNERSQPALEGKLDNFAIGEELEQERLDIVECRWAAEVEEDDGGGRCRQVGS
jgi:hypothetical protein